MRSPASYTVTLTLADNEGCSIERIFTGKAMLCNGSPGARTSQQVVIQAPKCAGTFATIIETSGHGGPRYHCRSRSG
jgi:hypothetical protein